MDKIRIDFFDILGYLIPGSALLIVFWIGADQKVKSAWQSFDSLHKADQQTAIIGIFLAYIAGFILHALGSSMYNLYCKKKDVFQNRKNSSDLSVQDKWALIREYGEKHISILERWYALRALAQNLSAVALISALLCIYKYFQHYYWEWWIFFIAHIAITYLLLRRSEIFHQCLKSDVDAVINKLRLTERI